MTFGPEIFTSITNRYLPDPHASLLNGIIFGIPIRTNKTLYTQLQVVGLLHLVVLSGMNITILGTLIGRLTSGFGRFTSNLITIPIIIIFIVFVRPQAPIIRAGFMGILTLVSFNTGKKTLAIYLLLVSALCTALIWPQWITTVSFQLSYAATLGLILFAGRSQKIATTKTLYQSIKDYCIDEFKTSMAAQVFTVPIIFLYFRQISLIAPVANVVVSWLIAPLMVIGFITDILGTIHYSLGIIPAYICYGILNYMIFAIECMAKIPYSFFQF